MKFSLVIGTRNRDYNLNYFLQSIAQQDFDIRDLELVIVNYGGEKCTKTLVDSFRFPNLKYIYVNETGIFNESRSKNIGIKHATGDVIICTNADIIFPPSLLKQFKNIYSRTSGRYLYQIRRADLPENYNLEVFLEKIENNNVNYSFFLQDETACGDFQAASRDNWYKVKGYDERMTGWGAMDLDLADRMKMIDIEQMWLDQDKIVIFHTYHASKAPSKVKINLELKKIPKNYCINTNWGEITHKTKIYFLIDKTKNKKVLHEFSKQLSGLIGYETRILNNDTARLSSVFYQYARNLAVQDHADYITEIDYLKTAKNRTLAESLRCLQKQDCVVSDFERLIGIRSFLSRALFGNTLCYNTRIYNYRLASVLCHRYFIPSGFFYNPQFFYYCNDLEQDVKIL